MELNFINALGLLGAYFAILLVLSLSIGLFVVPLTWLKWLREQVNPDEVLNSVRESVSYDVPEEAVKQIAIQTYVSQTKIDLVELDKSVRSIRDNADSLSAQIGLDVTAFQRETSIKWMLIRQWHLHTEESRIITLRVISACVGIGFAFVFQINTFEILGPLFTEQVLNSLYNPIGRFGGIIITGLASSAVSLYWLYLLDRMQTLANITRSLSRGIFPQEISSQARKFSEAAEELKNVDPSNIQEVAANQTKLLKSYHDEVLNQAKKSFTWAIIAAIIGLIFFIMAVGFLAYDRSSEIAIISTISGVLIEFISGVNFYLYSRTANQMASFQQRLEIIQRYLLANSMCESLMDDYKNRTRSDLIKSLVGMKDGLFLPPESIEGKVAS